MENKKITGYTKAIHMLAIAMILLLAACQKTIAPNNSPDMASETVAMETVLPDEAAIDAFLLKAERDNKTRLENRSETVRRASCKLTVRVPQDYATIQEAIDAACPGGDIIVSEGEYNEIVFIYKPGLHLKANGDVVLNGLFAIIPGASGTKIQSFTINPLTSFWAIQAMNVDDIHLLKNKVPNREDIYQGFILTNVNNSIIEDNYIDGAQWGIVLRTPIGSGLSSNNRILRNTIPNIQLASGIGLFRNCDNNAIDGNTINDKLTNANAGIDLASTNPLEACEGNTVKNNTCNNSAQFGFWDWGAGSNNVVGPNNVFNNNILSGIIFGLVPGIPATGSQNLIFKNTALGNGDCDIVDANGMAFNTYKNNTFNCFSDMLAP